jgi:hypothetical protein
VPTSASTNVQAEALRALHNGWLRTTREYDSLRRSKKRRSASLGGSRKTRGKQVKRIVVFAAILLILSGCDSFTAAPYGISADNNVALKSFSAQSVGIGTFTAAKDFDMSCRLAGPIQLPTGLNFVTYIQKALSDEFKVAGLYSVSAPVTLTGSVDHLAFSSMSGDWDITLTVHSSNGHTVTVAEHYEFHSSYTAESACHNVADAFQPAVQALIGKLFAAPEFRSLIQA